jgi:hypothetical protein
MLPNYLQTCALARAFAHARSFRLSIQSEGSGRRWALDLDTLRRAVTPRAKLPPSALGALALAGRQDTGQQDTSR